MTATNFSDAYRGHRIAPQSQAGALAPLLPLLPILILFYSTLLPPEMRITLADQNFYAPRLVGIVLIPWVVMQMVRGRLHLKWIDSLLLIGVFWMVFSFMMFYGLGQGIVRGSALGIDVLMPYLVARTSIRSFTDLRRLLVLMVPGIILIGGLMLVEAVAHRLIVRPLAISVFGSLPNYVDGEALGTTAFASQVRLGLLRAYGPFSHPILAGIFMSSMVPLYWTSGLRGWPMVLGVSAGLFAFFTGSSAAFLMLFLALGFLAYDRIQSSVTLINWPMLITAIVGVLLLGEIVSQNGIVSALTRYTLTPTTAEYRLYIWEYASRSVANYPFFGIGFTGYERPAWMGESIDNHWLMLAVRHGFLVPVLFLIMCLTILFKLGVAARFLPPVDRNSQVGLVITLFLLMLLGWTVSYFGSSLTWYFLVTGAAASLAFRDPPAMPEPQQDFRRS